MLSAERGQRIGAALLRTLYRPSVHGVEHLPTTGPVVLVANHVGFLDGPVAFIVCPRPVHFLVKRSFFDGPAGVVLRGVEQIPIVQNSADRAALTAARDILRGGGVVGVFPEGTRGAGTVESVQQGAAYLALQSQASVVPLALTGTAGRTRGAWPRLGSRMTCTFGPGFTLHDAPGVAETRGRARLAAASELLRQRLADHVAASRI